MKRAIMPARAGPPAIDDTNAALSPDDAPQIVFRPDGYYWLAPDGQQEIGPFASRELAQWDMARADDDLAEPGESLQEAEDEIGIADWIDPDTGEPAEGLSVPHFPSE